MVDAIISHLKCFVQAQQRRFWDFGGVACAFACLRSGQWRSGWGVSYFFPFPVYIKP
jgi:hypothetical protein